MIAYIILIIAFLYDIILKVQNEYLNEIMLKKRYKGISALILDTILPESAVKPSCPHHGYRYVAAFQMRCCYVWFPITVHFEGVVR